MHVTAVSDGVIVRLIITDGRILGDFDFIEETTCVDKIDVRIGLSGIIPLERRVRIAAVWIARGARTKSGDQISWGERANHRTAL